jgi:5-methylcytosine-specific restriction protein B
MELDSTLLRERFHDILDSIDLGHSGQGKFDRSGFNRLIAAMAGIGSNEVYTSGTSSPKAYNILNRMSQGKALGRRHALGVVVLGRAGTVPDAVRYAQRMVGSDRNFDAVAVVAAISGVWQVVALVESPGGPIAQRLQPFFAGLTILEPESVSSRPNVDSARTENGEAGHEASSETLPADDPILLRVQELLDDGFGGVVFRGPPGTSKTWYAARVAASLVGGDGRRIRTVQFHPSYQYEDFVEGFVPQKDGTFHLRRKHLLLTCKLAEEDDNKQAVLVIDEISRVDPARVFGEALTYLEAGKRGVAFNLASGRPATIPPNLVVLATMNVFDRGVAQIESALERRLAFIDMPPDVEILRGILDGNAVPRVARDAIIQFFRWTQSQRNPYVRIGHAYFNSVVDRDSLNRLWSHQLRFVFERAFPVAQEEGMRDVERQWSRIVEASWDEAPSEPNVADSRSPAAEQFA